MDLRLVIHRGLTLTAAVALSLVPVALLVAFFWPHLLSQLESDKLLLLLASIVVVALLVPITRDMAARFLDRYVYRTQANFRRTVREASGLLTRELNLNVLLSFLGRTVVTATQAEAVAVFVRAETGLRGDTGGRVKASDAGETSLALAVAEKRHSASPFEAPPRLPAAVLTGLLERNDLLLTDELDAERATGTTRETLGELTRLGWALVLPLRSEDGVIGAMALGPKLSGDAYYPHDLDLLMTLANQAGIAVKNAQLYAQVVLANEYLQNIVATIESGVIAVSAAGQVTMFNPSAGRLTGVPAARALAQGLAVLPACLARPLTDTVADGEARTFPEIALPKGTISRPVICTTSPLRDPAGAVLGAVAVFSDLTPLKELEAERRRAERLAYFEMLASGIAHEIKNPLVAIKTFAQLMPRRHTDEQFVEKFNRIVTREIERVEQIVQRLRALSRPAERPRHPLDIRGPVRDALEFMQAAFEEKSLSVVTSLGQSPCLVLGDHGELEELFLNLFVNAREAMPPGGALTVQVTATAAHVTVAVTDTGPGIPPELLERVFDPFFTTKQRGSGLGLAICAGIAQSHRARLRVNNRPAGGAIFTIELPLVTVPSAIPA